MRRIGRVLGLAVILTFGCAPSADDEGEDDTDLVDTDDTDAGSDTDDTDETEVTDTASVDPALAALLAGATPYGDEGTPLPRYARLVDGDELLALAASSRLLPIDLPGKAAAIEASETALQADRALVESWLQAHPELADRFEVDTTQPAVGTVLQGGEVEVELGATGERVLLDGVDVATRSFAASLRASEDPAALQDLYLDLYRTLPGDQTDGLPDEATVRGLTEVDTLRAHLIAVAERVEEVRPNAASPEDVRFLYEAVGVVAPVLNCPQVLLDWSDRSLLELHPPMLRPFLPPVRHQGNRGTCGAFGILGAAEILTRATAGRAVDLSEQDLYATAKGDWDPTFNDYGDGLPVPSILSRMVAEQYALLPEQAWSYNPSWYRVFDYDGVTYEKWYLLSCVDYDETCSETNHQRDVVCVTSLGVPYCFEVAPRDTLSGSTSVTLTGTLDLMASLPYLSVTVDAIKASVRSGRPVVLGHRMDEPMVSLTADAPFLAEGPLGTVQGYHAVTVVGVIDRYEMLGLIQDGAVPPPGLGWPSANDLFQDWFVVRNSWGCGWGERGYTYVNRAWLMTRLTAATKLSSVSANLPSVSLSASTTTVTSPTTVTFQAAVSGPVQTVELRRGGEVIATDTSPPFRFDVPMSSSYNGTTGWFAVGVDPVGVRVPSAVIPLSIAIPASGPVVSVQMPGEATAPGQLQVTVSASDPDGVARVELYRGGRGFRRLGSDTFAPYTFDIPLTADDTGSLSVYALAWDRLGQMSASQTVVVSVVEDTEGPTVVPSAPDEVPAPGSFVLSASVSDPAGVEEVVFKRGSTVIGADRTPPYAVTVPVGIADVGRTLYGVEATDRLGNRTLVFQAVNVVLGGPPGEVLSFDASRTRLSALGGTVTLDWSTTPDAVLTLSGVGDVSGETGWVLVLPPNATAADQVYDVDLTAETLWGSQTASLQVIVEALPAGWLVVDPVGGDDVNGDGSLGAPLQFLHTAVPRLASRGGVLLAPGAHRMLGRLDLPSDVGVRAADPGTATLVPWIVNQSSGWFRALGDAHFEGFTCASGGPCLETESGAVQVTDVQGRSSTCGGGGNSALVTVAGTAQVHMVATVDSHRWLDGAGAACLARVTSGSASLRIEGGRITDVPSTGVSGEAILYVGSGSLSVDGVVFEDNAPGVLTTWGGTSTFRDVQVRRVMSGVVGQLFGAFGSSALTLEDSVVEDVPSRSGVLVAGGTPQVTLRRTVMANLGSGIVGSFIYNAVTPTLVLEDSEIRASAASGVNIFSGSLSLVRSKVLDSGQLGISASGVTDLYLRDSWVRGNRNEGIRLASADPVTWDLGRGDDPGNNILAGNGLQSGEASVSVLGMPGGSILHASGNTWNAGAQGASGTGTYALAQGQVVLDVTATTTSGTNYTKPAAGTVRLAEDPCVPAGTCP